MLVRTALDLGALLRQRRRELGLNQQQLADRVGVSRLWLSQAEHGKSSAELGLMLRALEAVGVELRVEVNAETSQAAAHERPEGRARSGAAVDIDAIVARASK